MKISGAEWKRFYADRTAWGDGAWMDDTVIYVDGVLDEGNVDLNTISDTAVVDLRDGVYFTNENEDGKSLIRVFSGWRKRQSMTLVAVEIPNGKSDDLKAFVASVGGRLVG